MAEFTGNDIAASIHSGQLVRSDLEIPLRPSTAYWHASLFSSLFMDLLGSFDQKTIMNYDRPQLARIGDLAIPKNIGFLV